LDQWLARRDRELARTLGESVQLLVVEVREEQQRAQALFH
jgi:hypothetical protein